jgi:hypothetical protein
MATSSAQPLAPRVLRAEHDHELQLVEAAIALVATGGARRATLVLRHGVVILAEAQAAARPSGVVVRALWRPKSGCDIVVEPVA